MLLKEDIQRIVRTIAEAKRPVVGAAKAANTQKQVTQRVRASQDSDLEKFAPGATEKSKDQILQILKDTHLKLSKIFDSEGTPHSVRKIDSDHRLTSHLGRAIDKLSSK